MRDYAGLLSAGIAAQHEKLLKHRNKDGFEGLELSYLLQRLYDEYQELGVEIRAAERDYGAIRAEAADVANFAHMIIYNCDNLLHNS